MGAYGDNCYRETRFFLFGMLLGCSFTRVEGMGPGEALRWRF